MADLIDRKAVRLIESDANAYAEEWNDDYEKGFTDALNKVIALPSTEPEIIRCSECKHNPKRSWFECPMSGLNERQRPEAAWCWKGERIEDG